jgi:hypothetical protein
MAENRVEQRAYHGELDPERLAQTLVMQFDEGETRARWMRQGGKRAVVQIQSRRVEFGDPTTGVSILVAPTQTGLTVSVSRQRILGVAADMAKTGVQAWLNPMRLLGELDDIARNVRWLGLRSEIWDAVDDYCRTHGAGRGNAGMLTHVTCPYCGTPQRARSIQLQGLPSPSGRGTTDRMWAVWIPQHAGRQLVCQLRIETLEVA